MPVRTATPPPPRAPDRNAASDHVGTLLTRSAEHLAGRHLKAAPNCWRCRRERATESAPDG